TTYAYDADGELIAKTDGNRQIVTYTYDGFGRQVSEAWQGTPEVITTAYNTDGQVTSITDPSSAIAYTYDGQGRVKTVDNAGTPGAPHVVLTYAYDPAGNVVSLTDSVGGVTEGVSLSSYDAAGQLIKVVQTGAALQTKRVGFTYNAVGQLLT